jgi:glutathione S-transferase
MVDVMMSFPVQLGLARGNKTGLELPRIKAFLKRMEERPAYKRAIEKVGPLDVLS